MRFLKRIFDNERNFCVTEECYKLHEKLHDKDFIESMRSYELIMILENHPNEICKETGNKIVVLLLKRNLESVQDFYKHCHK